MNPVKYFIQTTDAPICISDSVGKYVSLRWTGRIICTVCGKKTNKSFGEGMCYNCFANAPENAECILRPELCQAHLGKGRDPEWENKHHNRPHYVYLALTNAVKVGVTRGDQIPTRWIDQGAAAGIILAETPYRQLAGFIEVILKDHFTDKTNWQKMLKNELNPSIDLIKAKETAIALIPEHFREYVYTSNEIVPLNYPVINYPQKVTSLSFEKTPEVGGLLIGIRGQYLIFDGGNVINIRSKSGYEVQLEFE